MSRARPTFAGFGAGSSLPPGPRIPRALQAIDWARRPLSFVESAHRSYGDAFTLRIRRGSPWVLLSDPHDVRRVFTASAETMRAGAGDANPLLGTLLGSRSVMLLDEPEHMMHRRFMLPAFHGERMRGYGEMMVDVARREIRGWPIGESFALWPRMQAVSMEVVMRATFGGADTPPLRRLKQLLKCLTDWLNNPRRVMWLNALGPRWLARDAGFRAVMAPVEAAVLDEVRRRRGIARAGERDDILSLLEQAYDKHGAPMTEQELRDELITLLSDGPTATSLAWAFERLLRHPDKLARLRTEVLTDDGDAYAEAVVKETLRLCPAVPLVMRRLDQALEIGGYVIPAETIVAPCVYLVHRREDIYPEPASFKPERFLDGPPDPYTWIPFGGGVRRCVAASFAQMEMKLVMQTILSEVELRATTASPEVAQRSAIAFAPSRQGLVTVTARTAGSPRAPSGVATSAA